MQKSIRRLLLLTMLLLLLLPGTALAANYDVWVGGVQVTDDNKANITGSNITTGTVSFDSVTSTLTLNNATITGVNPQDGHDGAGIYTQIPLTIELVGSNTVNGKDVTVTSDLIYDYYWGINAISYGIYADTDCNLTFTGTGSLEVTGGDVKNEAVDYERQSVNSYGICGLANITFKQTGTIVANGGNLTVEEGSDITGKTYGIYADIDITITNNSNIIATGGTYRTSQNMNNSGYYQSMGISASNTLNITDSELEATGGKVAEIDGVTPAGESAGIDADILTIEDNAVVTAAGKFASKSYGSRVSDYTEIVNSTVTATGKGAADQIFESYGMALSGGSRELSRIENSNVTAESGIATQKSYGMYINAADLEIQNSTVTAKAGGIYRTTNSDASGGTHSYGIYSSGYNISITDSTVTAESDDMEISQDNDSLTNCGISAGTLILENSNVTAQSGTLTNSQGGSVNYSYGIWANTTINSGTVTANVAEDALENEGTPLDDAYAAAMGSPPDTTNYTNPAITASQNADGTNPEAYTPNGIGTYKYLKIAPGYVISWTPQDGSYTTDPANGSDAAVVPGNTDFPFTLTIADGYKAGDNFTVTSTPDVCTLTQTNVNGNTYSYTLTNIISDTVITVAGIELAEYTITYENIEPGDDNGDNPAFYTIEDEIDLDSPTRDGYHFLGWTDETGAGITKIEKGSTGNKTLTANWEINASNTYTVTVHHGDGDNSYAQDAIVTITAHSIAGKQFKAWTTTSQGVTFADDSAETTTFTMPAHDVEVTATYEDIPQEEEEGVYIITLSVRPEDGGTVTGAGTYEKGALVTVVAEPLGNYGFVHWEEDGEEVSTATGYTFTVTADRELTALFSDIKVETSTFADEHISDELKEIHLDSTQKINDRLELHITEKDSRIQHTELWEVKLMYFDPTIPPDGDWREADPEHFPTDENGKPWLKVELEVPEGTSPETHQYVIAHMFSTNDFGRTAGNIEYPRYTTKQIYGKWYLVFHVTGLSPIMVGWSEKPDDGGNGSSSVTYHDITVEDADHGSASSNKDEAPHGNGITITVTPDDGYELDRLIVTDRNGREISVKDKGNGQYIFNMPNTDVTVTPVFTETEKEAPEVVPQPEASSTFSDIENHWAREYIEKALELELFSGMDEDSFGPDIPTSRGMFTALLWRMENRPEAVTAHTFGDVPKDSYYDPAIDWSNETDIVVGFSETFFGPELTITREQLAAVMWRYAQYEGLSVMTLEENLQHFTDQDEISGYAIPALNWAIGQGFMTGRAETVLAPREPATRAETAVFLVKFLERLEAFDQMNA